MYTQSQDEHYWTIMSVARQRHQDRQDRPRVTARRRALRSQAAIATATARSVPVPAAMDATIKCNGGGGCKSSCAGPGTAVSVGPAAAEPAARAPVVAAIDSGNGAFLSYGPGVNIINGNARPYHNLIRRDIPYRWLVFINNFTGSPLAAAKRFPFNITFEGGNTLVFKSPPAVLGKPTHAVAYSHNVLALGFMSRFDMTFDDAGHVVYFAEQ